MVRRCAVRRSRLFVEGKGRKGCKSVQGSVGGRTESMSVVVKKVWFGFGSRWLSEAIVGGGSSAGEGG